MYKPKIFTEDRIEVLHGLILANPLGLIITTGDRTQANLIPFSLHEGGAFGTLRCHMARANPQVDGIRQNSELLVVFNGPEAYVSAGYYPTKKENGRVVPTWNYSMVQARGKARLIEDPSWILSQIQDLTNHAEKDRSEPWKVEDAPAEYIHSQLKAIIGIELVIESLDGKFKISQNQPEVNRKGVEDGLRVDGKNAMADLVSKRR